MSISEIMRSSGDNLAGTEPVRFVVNRKDGPCKTAFPKLSSPEVSSSVLSFLNYGEMICFFSTSLGAQELMQRENNSLQRRRFAQVRIFGRAEYQHIWGVEITNEFDPENIDIRVLHAFLKAYEGPNPVDPKNLVKNTCLIPTVVPERVQVVGRVFEFNLELLGQLAEYPGGSGHLAKYARCNDSESYALGQYGTVKAERANLVLLLKGIIRRCERLTLPDPNERGPVETLQDLNIRTGYGCELAPGALSQNTVLLAHHALTNERPFGDDTGMEGANTYGYTREYVRFDEMGSLMLSGGFKAGAIDPLGSSAPAELIVDTYVGWPWEQGVGVLRTF